MPRWSKISIVREWNPRARVPTRSGVDRRSRISTSTPANASSPATIRPAGPPPTIVTSFMSPLAFLATPEKSGPRRVPCRKPSPQLYGIPLGAVGEEDRGRAPTRCRLARRRSSRVQVHGLLQHHERHARPDGADPARAVGGRHAGLDDV